MLDLSVVSHVGLIGLGVLLIYLGAMASGIVRVVLFIAGGLCCLVGLWMTFHGTMWLLPNGHTPT